MNAPVEILGPKFLGLGLPPCWGNLLPCLILLLTILVGVLGIFVSFCRYLGLGSQGQLALEVVQLGSHGNYLVLLGRLKGPLILLHHEVAPLRCKDDDFVQGSCESPIVMRILLGLELDSALFGGVLGPFEMMRAPVLPLAFLGHHCVWHSGPRWPLLPQYHILDLACCAFVVSPRVGYTTADVIILEAAEFVSLDVILEFPLELAYRVCLILHSL